MISFTVRSYVAGTSSAALRHNTLHHSARTAPQSASRATGSAAGALNYHTVKKNVSNDEITELTAVIGLLN